MFPNTHLGSRSSRPSYSHSWAVGMMIKSNSLSEVGENGTDQPTVADGGVANSSIYRNPFRINESIAKRTGFRSRLSAIGGRSSKPRPLSSPLGLCRRPQGPMSAQLRLKEQEFLLRKDSLPTENGALLIRPKRKRFRDLSPAGPWVWAGSRQCGGWRRADPRRSRCSIVQRTSTPNRKSPVPPPTRRSGSTRKIAAPSSAAPTPAIIMGDDEANLVRLWREKRGEVEPEDLSDNLIVQLGSVTEDLNRRWYERNTGHAIKDVQKRIQHPVHKWMAATLDGLVDPGGAVFEAKFMLPWTFSEEAAAEKHMAQLQHNMWVIASRSAVLSIITGGGKWVEMTIHADPLYQHLLLTAEKKFWRCVQNGETPRLFGVEPPRPRLEAVRIVDMSASNSWAEFAAVYRRTRPAYQEHESAKADLKKLVPEDAKEATGHGLRAKRSKSGAISFDLMDLEAADAPLQ